MGGVSASDACQTVVGAADVYALMRPAMQDLYANDAPVSGLDETNSQLNFLLHQ